MAVFRIEEGSASTDGTTVWASVAVEADALHPATGAAVARAFAVQTPRRRPNGTNKTLGEVRADLIEAARLERRASLALERKAARSALAVATGPVEAED